MKLCVYPNGFRSLSIDGNMDTLAEFWQKMNEIQGEPDGYLALPTTVVDVGDFTSLELCMTERIPVICTRVYRGKPAPLPNRLVFPSTVRLGAFRCNVSTSACHNISYALMSEARNTDETGYRVSDIICAHCGRDVSPISFQDYHFLYLYPDRGSKSRIVKFDVDDFVRTSRRGMRDEIGRQARCTMRAWRKGSSTAVIELTKEGIADLKENCIDSLISQPRDEFNHRHFYHLAKIGKLDYTELLLKVANIEQYGMVTRVGQVSFDKYLHVSWATCINLRCAYRFLTVQESWEVEYPTHKDYHDIPVGNSSCPLCRSSYYISDTACYKKSGQTVELII